MRKTFQERALAAQKADKQSPRVYLETIGPSLHFRPWLWGDDVAEIVGDVPPSWIKANEEIQAICNMPLSPWGMN